MLTPNRRSPDQFAERDLSTLAHVYRYVIGLYASIGRIFHDDKDAGNAIRKLGAKNLLTIHPRVIDGGVSYVTIAKLGLKDIGRLPKKLKQIGPTSFSLAIALSWYCCLEDKRRHRLLPEELLQLYSGVAENHPYVLEQFDGHNVVLKSYHAVHGVTAAKRKVNSFFDESLTSKHLRRAVLAKDFGLLVLAPNQNRVDELDDAFRKNGLFNDRRLVVGLGPTADTLAPLLRQRRRGQ